MLRKIKLWASTILGIAGITLIVISFNPQKTMLNLLRSTKTNPTLQDNLEKIKHNEVYGFIESPVSENKIGICVEPYYGVFFGEDENTGELFQGTINDPNTYVTDYSSVREIFIFKQ